ncbi:hypothetical protein ACWDG1_49310, partial [Streptomyces sp. NPDC001177]
IDNGAAARETVGGAAATAGDEVPTVKAAATIAPAAKGVASRSMGLFLFMRFSLSAVVAGA